MSESDGLQKLTAYLNQTRRQAEMAVDALNVQIEDLQKENSLYAQLCKKLEQEKDYYKNLADSAKNGGSIKQILKERDDWRALIDSVQKDRARLQEECCALESALDASNSEVEMLRSEIVKLTALSDANSQRTDSRQQSSSSPSRSQRPSLSIECNGEEGGLTSSASSSISGQELQLSHPGSPNTVIRQLQYELKHACTQVQNERQQAEAQRLNHLVEVARLQDELSAARPASATSSSSSSSTTYVLNGESNGRLTAQLQALNNGSSSSAATVSRPAAAGWLNPLGYIGYWFGGQPGGGGDAKAAAGGIIIIKV